MRELFAELLATAISMPASPVLLPLFSVLILWTVFQWCFPPQADAVNDHGSAGLAPNIAQTSRALPHNNAGDHGQSLVSRSAGAGMVKAQHLGNIHTRLPFEKNRGHWVSPAEITRHTQTTEKAATTSSLSSVPDSIEDESAADSVATSSDNSSFTNSRLPVKKADTRRSPSAISRRVKAEATTDNRTKLVANSHDASDPDRLHNNDTSGHSIESLKSAGVKTDPITAESRSSATVNLIRPNQSSTPASHRPQTAQLPSGNTGVSSRAPTGNLRTTGDRQRNRPSSPPRAESNSGNSTIELLAGNNHSDGSDTQQPESSVSATNARQSDANNSVANTTSTADTKALATSSGSSQSNLPQPQSRATADTAQSPSSDTGKQLQPNQTPVVVLDTNKPRQIDDNNVSEQSAESTPASNDATPSITDTPQTTSHLNRGRLNNAGPNAPLHETTQTETPADKEATKGDHTATQVIKADSEPTKSAQTKYQTAAKTRQLSSSAEAQIKLRSHLAIQPAVSGNSAHTTPTEADNKSALILADKNRQIAQLQNKLAELEVRTRQTQLSSAQATDTETGTPNLADQAARTSQTAPVNPAAEIQQPAQTKNPTSPSTEATSGSEQDTNQAETLNSGDLTSTGTPQTPAGNQLHAATKTDDGHTADPVVPADTSAVAFDDVVRFKRRYQQASEKLTLQERKIKSLQTTINRLQASGLVEPADTTETAHNREPLLNKVRVLS